MRPFLLALFTSLALPTAALAAGPSGAVLIPPSNPGANQYLENVPTATGGRSSSGVFDRATSGRRGTTAALPAATVQALTRYGADGGRTARLAAATAPAALAIADSTGTTGAGPSARTDRSGATGGAAGGVAGSRSSGGAGAATVNASGGRSARVTSGTSGTAPVLSVARAAIGAGSGGIDAWLPAALAVSALGLVAVALSRRRAG